MAAFDTTRTTYGAAFDGNRISHFVSLIIAKFAAWNDARMTRNALVQLTDRELDDIGLVRGDIDLVATSKYRA